MNRWVFIGVLFSVLAACGGGSGEGDSSDPVSDQNSQPGQDTQVGAMAEELSYVAAEISKRAIAAENTPNIGLPIGSSGPSSLAFGKTETDTATDVGDCGGSLTSTVTTTTPDDETVFFPFSIDASFVFDSYCSSFGSDFQFVYDGTMEYEFSVDEDSRFFFISYDLAYTSNSELVGSGVIQATETCTQMGDEPEECSSSSSYEFEDGTDYELSEFEVSGSATEGYSFSGEIADDEGSSFSISVTDIVLCEDGEFIQSGEIVVTDLSTGDSISVTFINCEEFVVTYQGISETFPQDFGE